MDAILSSHDRRSALVERFREAIAAYKHSKNVKAFKATKKQLEEKYQAFTDDITAQSKKLQAIDAEAGAKVSSTWLAYYQSCTIRIMLYWTIVRRFENLHIISIHSVTICSCACLPCR